MEKKLILPTLARLLVRECQYKPLGSVLVLGRQTVDMTIKDTIKMFEQENYAATPIDFTEHDVTRYGKRENITDKQFFTLLGASELLTLDVSDYEQADIIHDLNEPVEDELYRKFDFIIDGGTLDHCVDIKTCLENIVKMLKPGGRIFQWDAASNFVGAAYMSFSPDLFYDFYTLNRFNDCKVYIAEVDKLTQRDSWDFYQFDGSGKYTRFHSSRIQMVVVLAEKGINSTSYKLPVQAQYRDAKLQQQYKEGQQIIAASKRSLLQAKHYHYKESPIGFKYLGRI